MKISKKLIGKVALSTVAIGLAFGSSVSAVTANLTTKNYNVSEKIVSTGFDSSFGKMGCEITTSSYDFIDEDGLYNSVYISNGKVYWSTFDSNYKLKNTRSWAKHFTSSDENNSNFGGAIYKNGYLYVVYSRDVDESIATRTSPVFDQAVLAIGKYDKNGDEVILKEYLAKELSNSYDSTLTSFSYGTSQPFYLSNCSIAANNEVIALFFGRNTFRDLQASLFATFYLEDLTYVNNLYDGNHSLANKYSPLAEHYVSESLGQRIISIDNNQFLLMEVGDSNPRGLNLTQTYNEGKGLNLTTREVSAKVVNFRESKPEDNGNNYTYQSLGSLVELDDGYMYIGAIENDLSVDYGRVMNQPTNIFVQKYTKDFGTMMKECESEIALIELDRNNGQFGWDEYWIRRKEKLDEYLERIELLRNEQRTTTGTKPQEVYYQPLYLEGDEVDYGMKFLTALDDTKTVSLVRAVELEDNRVAILWEESTIESDYTNGYNLVASVPNEAYYMIINSKGTIVQKRTALENVNLSREENYTYDDGKIIWTTANDTKKIQVNVLDVNNPIFADGEILKGDLDENGVVNANDASIALDLFKNESATIEDIRIGDMDGDGEINANDASIILDTYKNSNVF